MIDIENLRIRDGKIYEIQNVPFARTLVEHKISEISTHSTIQLAIPKIPYPLFKQVVAWQRAIAKEHSCESTCSLFLDRDTLEWKAVAWHQQNTHNSMTADVSFKEGEGGGYKWEENAALMAEIADQSDVHATIHNHVNAGASQSGRDADDEKGLPGPHITIGCLNQDKLAFHARLSTYVTGPDGKPKHQFLALRPTDIIDFPMPPGALTPTVFDALETAWLTFKSTDDEIPEEWKDRFQKKSYAHTTYGGGSQSSYRPSGGTGLTPSTGTAAGKVASGETLEEFINANRGDIATWPYAFLDGIDSENPEEFLKALRTMNATEMHAAQAVLDAIAPAAVDYVPLFEHLRTRRSEGKGETKASAT